VLAARVGQLNHQFAALGVDPLGKQEQAVRIAVLVQPDLVR
jgi:hypothetical protein